MYKPLPFSSFIILLFLAVPENCYSQSNSKDSNEDWDNTLEKAGDYIQLAVPITAGVTTLIIKDYEGTKQFAFSYEKPAVEISLMSGNKNYLISLHYSF